MTTPAPSPDAAPPPPTSRSRRRTWLALAAALTVAAGLGARVGLQGVAGASAWTGPLGDALYAVLIYLLIALALPRARRRWVAWAAFVVCAGIELFQLTGIPATLGEQAPLARLILGTGFSAPDLLLYLVGAVAAGIGDTAFNRAGSGPRGRSRPRSADRSR